MQVQLKNVEYKGKHFEEVKVNIPTVTVLEDNHSLIRYFICKELDRILRG